ncbi:universal stress protein [Pseudomonas boanensis]|uniref:universal stress protein n=1 Tax=Metapseudomonas boanensis TaxID=2822138 RepID=UPI0035D51B1F
MSQYRCLYLIAEPSLQSAAALQRATALAQASGAALHILTFFEPTTSMRRLDQVDQALLRESALQQCRHWVEEQAAQVRAKGIQVFAEAICTDDPLEEILIQIAEQKPDMVIKGAQTESELLRTFVTPLDWYLLSECPVPVHLVGAIIHPLPRKVIAAVDVSDTEEQVPGLNQRIIQAANGLALQCNADLHLLYVCDLSSAHLADALALAWETDFTEDQRAALWSAFTAMAERFSVPLERRHFVVGRTISSIADFAAQSRADVIVMGRVQRHGLEKMLGSTAEHVLQRVPCSILAVEPG